MVSEFMGLPVRHDALLIAQRAFVTAREKLCGATGLADVGTCVAEQTSKRISELNKLSRVSDTPLAFRSYKIAGEIIAINRIPAQPEKSLLIKGSEPLEASEYYPWDIWKTEAVTGVMIEAFFGGTDQCRAIEVVMTRRPGTLALTELGQGCEYGPDWQVLRTAHGFAFEEAAQPFMDGSVREWVAETGAVTVRPVKFAPQPNLTMDSLLQSPRASQGEPLNTFDFYDTINGLPDADRGRVLKALRNVGNGCGTCQSPDDQLNRYGVQTSPELAAYSGCGWIMSGAHVMCSDADVLAVWDRTTRKAYVAVDAHNTAGLHALSSELRLYPARGQWPRSALAKLDAWMKGAVWTP
jgi:hypothetical protein